MNSGKNPRIRCQLGLSVLLAGGLLHGVALSQSLDWVVGTGGPGHDSANSIALDRRGNVYTTGSFGGTVDFDPGAGSADLKALGGTDIFVQKLSAEGRFEWARRIGGLGGDYGRTVIVDPTGNIYVIGSFQQTADFDPGKGAANLTAAGSDDIFILKLDASGHYVWAKRMGGPGSDMGFSLTADRSGNICGTGYFSSRADFDPGATTHDLVATGGHEIFVNKLDATGNFLWAKSMGSTTDDWGISIRTDSRGNVYATGHFGSAVDFDPGKGRVSCRSAGGADIFVQKLDPTGAFVWVRQMGGPGHDQGRSIATDAQDNLYLTGSFEASADFDPDKGSVILTSRGSRDVFVQKLDADGGNVWVTQIGGPEFMRGNSVEVDRFGNVYTTGRFRGAADLDPGPARSIHSSKGNDEYFLQKLDADGGLVWTSVIGGISSDHGHCLALDNNGSVYSTGTFQGEVDFDPDSGAVPLRSQGGNDIFIQKLDQP